jgi:aryl-alcohol dehydrogenase-like predicted oxidoreductase
MRSVPLGGQGLVVSAQGLGCMGMSQSYGLPDDTASANTLHRAVDLGVTFLDTADVYGTTGAGGFGANERLLGSALASRRDEFVLATKCGIRNIVATPARFELDASPEYVRAACDASLRRLRTDHIDLYYLHRVDPRTPIEDSIAAMAELVAAGKVRYLGVSEVDADQLEAAHRTHPITAVQSEYSLWTRGIEDAVLPAARRLGIGIVPFSPLGRGFLTATISSTDGLADNDARRRLPRFTPDALRGNQRIVDIVREIAVERGCLPGQVALAWVHSRGPDIVPIPGTKRVEYLEQNVAALDVELSADDLARLDGLAAETVGTRY